MSKENKKRLAMRKHAFVMLDAVEGKIRIRKRGTLASLNKQKKKILKQIEILSKEYCEHCGKIVDQDKSTRFEVYRDGKMYHSRCDKLA
jgi:hypothetical protein